ncbi:MAG: two-component regulator propeller domain-containing protein [Bacteroidota bacterium]
MKKLLVVILLCITLPSWAQKPFSRDYWLNDAGVPIKVNALILDESGYIWVGTADGLYYFNGRTFNKIADTARQPITALTCSENCIWIGYANGNVSTCINNTIMPYEIFGRHGHSTINNIYKDKLGILWLCTESEGIYCVVNNAAIVCNTNKGLSDNFIYAALELPYNSLLAGSDKGINIISLYHHKVNIDVITTLQGLPDNIVKVLKKVPDTTQYWIGTQQQGIAIFDYESKKILPYKYPKWKWGQVNDIEPVDKEHAWVATDEGYLLKIDLQSDSMKITQYSMAGDKIKKLLRDKVGNIWCATNRGITMVMEEYMGYIPLKRPFSLQEINALASDNDRYLWFAQSKELYQIDLANFNDIKHIFTAEATITSLHFDNHKQLWIGTLGKGLWYYDRLHVIRHITTITNLTQGQILDISGYRNEIWVSTLNGVEELVVPESNPSDPRLINHHSKHSGVGSDYVYHLYPDKDDHMWMATDGAGVSMYDGREYSRWDSSSGFKSQVVYSITQDAYGTIWAGTLNNGLFHYSNEKWHQYELQDGLQDVNISAIMGNKSGQIIVVNKKGIDEWYPDCMQFRHFNRRLDINIDSLSVQLNCIAKDVEGNVFVPYEHGIIVFKNIFQKQDIMPDVHISGLSLFFQPIEQGLHDFSYPENHITIKYDGINYSNPERLHYRYALNGFNDSWILTNDESVTFPKLPPGTYSFRVQVSLSNNFFNAKESSYTFTIAAPLWKRTWFIAAMLLLIGILIYYIQKLRDRRVSKVSLLQKERMIFEYEHLKSQVNPHFLFNSLNTLASLIEENTETAIDYTVHLSDLYRNMLAYKDKDLILLVEEMELLQKYLYIQQSRFGSALQLKVNISEKLLMNKKIVPLALQLLVENAIKHNVVSISSPLIIYIDANEYTIVVRNWLQPKMNTERGAGLGLINIRKRYFLLAKRQISYGVYDNEYIVILPLI